MGIIMPPGPMCQATKPVNVQDGINALTPSSTRGPTRGPEKVSFEIGASFFPVPTSLSGLDAAEMQVLAWLRENRRNIANAEQTFRVDRRAIAGAIAWEMLVNVQASSPISVGAGKIHTFHADKNSLVRSAGGLAWSWVSGDLGGGTIAKETEEFGYLPAQSYESRKAILATPSGAITYIAGIMAAIADIAGQHKFDDIRSNPVILTHVYNSKTLKTWIAHLAVKTSGSPFSGGTLMSKWVGSHLLFLEDGVGRPNLPESEPVVVSRMPPGSNTPSQDKTIEVVAGSTLSGIAEAEYGSWELWPLIYDHNRAKIGPNPNMIHPGLRLSIMSLSGYTTQEVAEARRRAPTWRQLK